MNKILVILAALTLFSCSSTEKNTSMESTNNDSSNVNSADNTSKNKKNDSEKDSKKMTPKSSVQADNKIICQSGTDSREIATVKNESGGCEVLYTKFGNTESKATAVNDLSYCDEISNRIKGNLENAGFSCK